MPRLTISLPEEQRAFLQQAVASGEYATESEVLRELIRERQRRVAQERLDNLLLEGLKGDKVAWTDAEKAAMWDEARRRLKSRRTT